MVHTNRFSIDLPSNNSNAISLYLVKAQIACLDGGADGMCLGVFTVLVEHLQQKEIYNSVISVLLGGPIWHALCFTVLVVTF